MNGPTFATIRRILLDLGFQERSVAGPGVLFERPGTDIWFLLRAYREDEVVWPPNVLSIRDLLDARGILSGEQFDELVREHSLAG
jgi:hypothetical protein